MIGAQVPGDKTGPGTSRGAATLVHLMWDLEVEPEHKLILSSIAALGPKYPRSGPSRNKDGGCDPNWSLMH